METILIIDDEAFIRENIERILGDDGYRVLGAATGPEALDLMARHEVDLALLDLNLGTEQGSDVLRSLKELDPELLVIIITGYGSVESAVESLRQGAYHYMKKPFKADALRVIVKLALQTQVLKREVRSLKRADSGLTGTTPLLGVSPAFREVVRLMREVAPTPATVLITGESGTGKELVARGVHGLSPRREAPFVGINCASIPAALLESELFGHERGSFTNATERKPGLFEEAHGGTLFLDEIGEMEPAMQAKLLRVLQEKRIRRVGGVREVAIDVRVLAATNRDLTRKIASGSFREDLYYRLNVFPIVIPPLRERREDIPLLATFHLDTFSRLFGSGFQEIDPEALRMLRGYDWPGNVRELRNILERICIMHRGPLLRPSFLPPELLPPPPPRSTDGSAPARLPEHAGLEEAVAALEKGLITAALSGANGNVLQAAQRLRIPRGTLRYKMEKYGLPVTSQPPPETPPSAPQKPQSGLRSPPP